MNNLDNNNIKSIENVVPEQRDIHNAMRMILLHDGTWVAERFYDQILQLILDVAPALEVDRYYTAKKLCGNEFWNTLKKSQRIKAGKCVVDMVRKNLLPLCFAGPTKANSQQYKLK